mgnify:CR=1 FL=1
MKFLAPLVALLFAASTDAAFVPSSSRTVALRSTTARPLQKKHHVLHMSAVEGDEDKNSNDVFSKLPDFNMESFDIVKVRDNVMDGEFGTRGEVFAGAQFALLFCILIGGIPIVGDFLMVLLGPGLLAAGLGTLVLSVKDLGNKNISPWITPPSGGDLVTDGLYAQLRHPFYAGVLATMAGFSIVTGSANRLLLTGILFYALNVIAEKEEEELMDEYSGYKEYADRVPGRFFPNALLDQLPWNKKYE